MSNRHTDSLKYKYTLNPEHSEGFICINNLQSKRAFTLAEVLITLGIIGIVAAMTIPVLLKNKENEALKGAFQKSYSSIINAYNLAKVDGVKTNFDNTVNYDSELAEAIYSKFSIINKISVAQNNSYKAIIKTYAKKSARMPECSQLFNSGFGITTKDGSAINVVYNCNANFITVDTNGISKGPNAYGHDIFLFAITNEGKFKVPANESEQTCDEEGNCSYNNTPENADKCSPTATSSVNGILCATYAILNKCPFDSSKTYWECLP